MSDTGGAGAAGGTGWGGLISSGVSAVGKAYAARIAARGAKMNLEFAASEKALQAQFEDIKMREVAERGSAASFKQRLELAQRIGSQRARFAAKGVSTREGSAANILADTKYIADMDAETLANDTQRKMWLIRQGAMSKAFDATMLRANARSIKPQAEFITGLISGATQFSSDYYRLRRSGALDRRGGFAGRDPNDSAGAEYE